MQAPVLVTEDGVPLVCVPCEGSPPPQIDDAGVPLMCSPHRPQRTMPKEAHHPLVERYIHDLEHGVVDFLTIPSNGSVPAEDEGIKTFNAEGDIVDHEGDDPKASHVGYIWRQLSDSPIVVGITKGIRSDHDPHFHPQAEAYYVISGRAKTLCDHDFVWMEPKDYFYIPGNTIHNTPITEEEGLSVLYWYPQDAHFNTFKYKWRKDVKCCPDSDLQFARVDDIRFRSLGLNPYGLNSHLFCRMKNESDVARQPPAPPR
jgi:mannose-6-phosphate isomerase-like protein (cupin superfamily)